MDEEVLQAMVAEVLSVCSDADPDAVRRDLRTTKDVQETINRVFDGLVVKGKKDYDDNATLAVDQDDDPFEFKEGWTTEPPKATAAKKPTTTKYHEIELLSSDEDEPIRTTKPASAGAPSNDDDDNDDEWKSKGTRAQSTNKAPAKVYSGKKAGTNGKEETKPKLNELKVVNLLFADDSDDNVAAKDEDSMDIDDRPQPPVLSSKPSIVVIPMGDENRGPLTSPWSRKNRKLAQDDSDEEEDEDVPALPPPFRPMSQTTQSSHDEPRLSRAAKGKAPKVYSSDSDEDKSKRVLPPSFAKSSSLAAMYNLDDDEDEALRRAIAESAKETFGGAVHVINSLSSSPPPLPPKLPATIEIPQLLSKRSGIEFVMSSDTEEKVSDGGGDDDDDDDDDDWLLPLAAKARAQAAVASSSLPKFNVRVKPKESNGSKRGNDSNDDDLPSESETDEDRPKKTSTTSSSTGAKKRQKLDPEEKAKRELEKLEQKRKKEGEAQQKKLEKLKEKEAKKEQMEREKAEKSLVRTLTKKKTAQESMKDLIVKIDAGLLEKSMGTDLLKTIREGGCEVKVDSNLIPGTVTILRKVPKAVRNKDTNALETLTEKRDEEWLIYYLSAEELMAQHAVELLTTRALANYGPNKIVFYVIEGVSDLLKQKRLQEQRNVDNLARGKAVTPTAGMPTEEDVNDRLVRLQISGQCCIIQSKNKAMTCTIFGRILETVAEAPYHRKQTDLDFEAIAHSGNAIESYLHILELVQGVTPPTAKAIAAVYPTLPDLLAAYKKTRSPDEARSLLQNINVDRLTSIRKLGLAISARICTVLTSEDPNFTVPS